MKSITKKYIKLSCNLNISKLNKIMRGLINNFLKHDVSRSAAALSYNLLFTLFPLLIFINNLIGLLNLDVGAIIKTLELVLPQEIVEIVSTYLKYISETSSSTLFWFSLIFSIYFPMRASKSLMDTVRRAYHLGKPKRPFLYIIRHFVFTIILLASITVILLFSITGQKVLTYITRLVVVSDDVVVPNFAIILWNYFRFLLIGAVMFFVLGILYSMSHDDKQSISSLSPGILISLIGWIVISIAFSFYVENFARYSIIYGTLGAIIVLMVWLYITSIILILGAELNVIIMNIR